MDLNGSRQFRGDKLRALRKARSFSQSVLGARIGAHVTSVSDWERGDNAPSGRHVASLARELGVPAEHFYGEQNGSEDDEESDPVADLTKAIRRIVRDEARRLVRAEAGAT